MTISICLADLSAIQLVNNDDLKFNLNGRTQIYGMMEHVEDRYRDNTRLFLFLKQARLQMHGSYEDYKYNIQFASAGEDETRATGLGVSLNMLDFSFDIPVGDASLKIGQFKVPFGRESLSDSGYINYTQRSLNQLGFSVGRDVGLSYNIDNDKFKLMTGLFTGAGRSTPERFIPETLGVPMLVLRVGYDSGLDDNYYALHKKIPKGSDKKVSYFINALFTKDTLVGHSTALRVRKSDKSLLLNGQWNPYIDQKPLDQGNLFQLGVDWAMAKNLKKGILNIEAEYLYGKYENDFGEVSMTGGRLQASLKKGTWEYALRYSFLDPDEKFANKGIQVTGGSLIHEIAPAITYHLKKMNKAKIVFDFPTLINVPVVEEIGFGSYVLTEQPDQASYVGKGGFIDRETVYQIRALLQLSF